MAEVLYKPSTSDARSSSSSRYHRSRQPRMTATLPAVTLTGKVVRRTTRVLLESEGFHQEHVLALISFEENEPEVWQKVEKVADNIKRLIADLKKAKKVPTCIDYEQLHWVVHDGNIHSEFKRVTEEMFKDGVHWGKIVALLSFTTNYTLYAIRQGMDGSIVESVCGWTVIFMERELGDWFQEHSWEEFVSYAGKVLAGRQRQEMETPIWQRMATIGGAAIGLGAVLAFSIRSALS